MPSRQLEKSCAEALIKAEDGLMRATGQSRRIRPTVRAVLLGVFFSAVLLVGLTGVYTVHQGTRILTAFHPPAHTGTKRTTLTTQASGAAAELPTALEPFSKAGLGKEFVSEPLTKQDLVAAFVTDAGHEDFVRFSRVWRQGMRTFVATNHSMDLRNVTRLRKEYNETWIFYPDDKPLRTLALKGDTRAAMVPFLAHREYLGVFKEATYKWLLYGDDDTFYFTDAVLKVLSKLDHNMPYFLTDHMWWTEKWLDEHGEPQEDTYHPHPFAPVCAPCNYDKNTSKLPFPSPPACPCTPPDLCAAAKEGVFHVAPRGQCGLPRVPIRTFSMHGGAGGILSAGLLREVNFEAFEDCVHTTYTTGGDALISICTWQMGYGMTSPDPMWHPKGLSLFDVGREAQDDHVEIIPRVAHLMGNLLDAGAGGCRKGLCKLELDHFLTLHMRSRKFPSRAAHFEISRILAALADLAAGRTIDWSTNNKDAKKRAINERVDMALDAIRNWRQCQESFNEVSKTRCISTVERGMRVSSKESSKQAHFHKILNDSPDQGPQMIAAEIVQYIFELLPSTTGTYGDIAQGRE